MDKKSKMGTDRLTNRPTDGQSGVQSRVHAAKKSNYNKNNKRNGDQKRVTNNKLRVRAGGGGRGGRGGGGGGGRGEMVDRSGDMIEQQQ